MEGHFVLIHLLVTIVTFLGLYLVLNYMSYLAITNWDAPYYLGINTSPVTLSSSISSTPFSVKNMTNYYVTTRSTWLTEST